MRSPIRITEIGDEEGDLIAGNTEGEIESEVSDTDEAAVESNHEAQRQCSGLGRPTECALLHDDPPPHTHTHTKD